MERWVWGVGAAAGVVGGTVAAAAVMAHFITRARPLGHAPGSALGTLIDDVRFRADDGVTLHGWLFGHPAPRGAIALGHGFGMTRVDLVDLARALRERGYAVLLFDFRAHGGSEGRRSSIGYHEARDVVAAARYLRRRPELAGCGIGALGMSMGAAATVIGGCDQPHV
ncbi:MAG: alpha/beta hydrolase [Thermomicrobiales bacterium]